METDLSASSPGIFAAGDCVYGTKSVIQAIESGRRAASQIDRYLGGDGDISETLAPAQHPDPCMGCVPGFGYLERKEPAVRPAEERQNNFNPFDQGLSASDACEEAGRCLQCDLRLQIDKPHLWGDYANGTEGRNA